MLFNSFGFIFVFLPIVLCGFYFFLRFNLQKLTIFWLIAASLIFYAQWNIDYLVLLLASICFNYCISTRILYFQKNKNIWVAKKYLLLGVFVDLILLGYYKYTNFGINALNKAFHWHIPSQNIILPLGISFFTFTQIAYIVDAFKLKVTEYSFAKYCLFVTYFPHLIAGPILHHGEMIPQFNLNKLKNNKIFLNIYFGLLIFIVGLFKKIMIADPLSLYVAQGFDQAYSLSFFDAWITSLSYTFQLFFDFSGYSDMALGLGLMFQTYLPINFNCPYRAINIQDFWRRWHITLSNFLRDYIYIPLGGNRGKQSRLYGNIIITFLIGGLWHGAGWLFLIWGGLHGFALVIHRQFQKFHHQLGNIQSWFITFLFVNFAWVFFRANSFDSAKKIIKGMYGANGFTSTYSLFNLNTLLDKYKVHYDLLPFLNTNKFAYLCLIVSIVFAAILTIQSTHNFVKKIKPNFIMLLFILIATILLFFNLNKSTEFLYFNF
ncbi:TPA: MBOAT family protein [Legionella pneumophila]|nr:MBOAT family protein [Legionella pneumophila]HCU6104544.1 MBOAT family protein [Legionella pneumophila]HEE0244212.1 MBOAT family protein [Legionella pneumophila]